VTEHTSRLDRPGTLLRGRIAGARWLPDPWQAVDRSAAAAPAPPAPPAPPVRGRPAVSVV